MLLKEQKARRYIDKEYDLATEPVEFKLLDMVEIGQYMWDQALLWAAEHATTVEIGFSRKRLNDVDQKSILAGKTVEA